MASKAEPVVVPSPESAGRARWARVVEWWRALPEQQRTRIQTAGFLLLAAAVWVLYYWRHRFIAISDPDAEDYAQIARQIFLGRGMTSRTIPLCGLEYLRLAGLDPSGQAGWPNLHRFPFMSLVEVQLFRVFGMTNLALALGSGIFYVLTIPLVFLLGQRLFGKTAAIAGTLLYMAAHGALDASITGLTEPATTFFFMLVLLLLTAPKSRAALALAGLAWGLCFWNRYTGAMLALPLGIYLWVQDRRRAPGNLAAFLIPMAAMMAPEMWRNFRVAHDPLFSLTAALMVPYRSPVAPIVHWWYVPVYVKPSDIMLAWPGAMLDKWWNELYGGWRYLPLQSGNVYLYPFLVLSLLLRTENVHQRRMRILTIAIVCMHEATLPFLSNIVRYYAYLMPLFILFASWSLVTMARRLAPVLWPAPAAEPDAASARLFHRAVPALVAFAALCAPMVFGWIRVDGARPRMNPNFAWVDSAGRHMDAIREWVPADEVVMSDAPWSVAWRTDRRSVPFPSGPALVPFVEQEYHLNVGGIYLIPRRVDALESANWRAWEAVRDGRRKVPGFVTARRFPDGAILLVKRHPDGGSEGLPLDIPQGGGEEGGLPAGRARAPWAGNN